MKIKLFDEKCMPAYSKPNDAAMDVFAKEETEWFMEGGLWRANVKLGFALELPPEYGLFLLPRSGSARRESINLVNGVGLGDRSFGNNEYEAMLIKQAVTISEPEPIKQYQKIAQFVILHVPKVQLDVVDDFEIDEVQKKGFGSSGTMR